MRVYELRSEVDACQHMNVVNERDLEAFDAAWGAAIADTWTPVPVQLLNKDLPLTDTPNLLSRRPILSRRAVDSLRTLLDGNGELLPIACDGGEYFFFNVTRLIDSLDQANCRFRRSPPRGCTHIEHYAFHAERLTDATVFKLPNFRYSDVFVTDTFVEAVRRSELTGFKFVLRWSDAV